MSIQYSQGMKLESLDPEAKSVLPIIHIFMEICTFHQYKKNKRKRERKQNILTKHPFHTRLSFSLLLILCCWTHCKCLPLGQDITNFHPLLLCFLFSSTQKPHFETISESDVATPDRSNTIRSAATLVTVHLTTLLMLLSVCALHRVHWGR